MFTNQKNLGTPLVVMTREDFDSIWSDMESHMVKIISKAIHLCNAEEAASAVNKEERLLSRQETANMLHVKYTTLWEWNKSGYLKLIKVGARRVVYRYSDVLALAKERGL